MRHASSGVPELSIARTSKNKLVGNAAKAGQNTVTFCLPVTLMEFRPNGKTRVETGDEAVDVFHVPRRILCLDAEPISRRGIQS